MVNSIELYYESGYRTGKAMRHGDAAFAAREKEWMRFASGLEQAEDQVAARQAFSQGYSDANLARQFEPFK